MTPGTDGDVPAGESTTRVSGQMSSVLRTFQVLEAVSARQPVLLRHLVKELGYSKSTLQRTLTTLEAAGWIKQSSPTTPTWEVTARSLLVKPLVMSSAELYSRARGPMTALMESTRETIHLSIYDKRDRVVLIDRVDCDQSVRTYSPIGDSSPLHATATGKAVLAYLGDKQIDEVAHGDLPSFTANTLTTPETLRADLALVRERRFSFNGGEYRPAVTAIGAPVFDPQGRPIAAICISMPTERFEAARLDEFGRATRAAADLITLPRD
jgi:IclR family acetate operon transcriptional repressor